MKTEQLDKLIFDLKAWQNSFYHTDFLLTWKKNINEIENILRIAEALKLLRDQNISTRVFDSGLGVSLFRDKSTRTRFSFSSACNLLGLEVQDLDEEKSQISHGETVRETACMISFMTDIIGIRDDLYLGEGNKYMTEVGKALDDAFENGILPQRPGIINLQCDYDHPTQALADMLHLKKHFGSLENLKGKKIAMTWAYSPSYGKPLSVPQGVIALMTRFGMNVQLAYPDGYNLVPEIIELADRNALESGGTFKISNSMNEAFQDADIVYPKSWAPISVIKKRTELLMNKNIDGLKQLEKECLKKNAEFVDWECDEEKMKQTKNGEAIYLHCLPADISAVSCKNGEVSKTVFEKFRLLTYLQAGFKPYLIAAMILTNRFENPVEIFYKTLQRNTKRIL